MGEGANLLRLGTMAVVQVGCLALLSGGCAHPKAKTIADLPPLEMPVPPPRDIETSEAEPLPPVPLPAEPAHNAPPRARPAPPARESRAAETPKPEPARPEAATESEPPKAEEPARPPTTLQTTPTEAQGEVERNIRSTLARATNDLNRIDYRLLNADARTQYDAAKSFIREADLAVKARNLVYAKSLADKAAALAVQLGGK
jgi:type IV secretory pathway VirB10-like protein